MLTDELLLLQETVRRFVDDELVPLELDVPESDHLPPDVAAHLRARLQELGIWALGVPESLGGGGASVLAQIVVTEELSRSLLGLALAGRTGHPLAILYAASPEQQERYLLPVVRGEQVGAFALTELGGGSDPVGHTKTRAVETDGGWVIDGRKCFISLGDVADYVVVFAVTDPAAGARGISAFVVERGTPGYEVARLIPTMGSLTPAELVFDHCVVPDANRIGEVGEGFVLAQQLLGRARAEIGARAVGAASRLLEMAIAYVGERESFGTLLADHQGVQWMLADCAIDIEASRSLTHRAAERCDAGSDTRTIDAMVKVFSSEALCRVADRVLQLFGGWGYSKDLPIERFYREARMWRIVEGPNEVHRWAIARALNRSGIAALQPS